MGDESSAFDCVVRSKALSFFIKDYNDFNTGITNLRDTNELHIYFFNICSYFVNFNLLEKVKKS